MKTTSANKYNTSVNLDVEKAQRELGKQAGRVVIAQGMLKIRPNKTRTVG